MIKKIIKKVAKLVASPLFLANRLYKHTNHYRNQFVDMYKFTGEHPSQAFTVPIPHNLDVINLGSNHPKFAFDYTNTGVSGYNMAVGPQTFEYDFMVLQKYHSFLRRNGVVIIPVCPLNFFLSKYKSSNCIVKYYGTFDDSMIPDFDANQKKREYQYPLIYHPKRAKFLIKDVKVDTRIELTSNPMTELQLVADGKMWVEKCWNPEFDIDIQHMKPLSEENKQAIDFNIKMVRQMIEFCLERGYKPVIAYLPVTNYLSSQFPEDFFDVYVKPFVSRAIEGYDIPQYDYFRDSRFTDAKLYINSFFMNRVGASIFTKQIILDMTKDKILTK